jgi:hypothetical protein
MAMSSSLAAGAGVAGAVVAALAAILGSGAGLEPALGVPARKRNIINFFFQFRSRVAEQFWPVRYQELRMPSRTFQYRTSKHDIIFCWIFFWGALARGKEAAACFVS